VNGVFNYPYGFPTETSRLTNYWVTPIWTTNRPPVADANGPYDGDEGSPVTLDSSGSSDIDGDLLSYSWSVDSGLCTFDDPAAVLPDLTCTDNGSFTVTLVADDGNGATDSDTATVTVRNVPPVVTITSYPMIPIAEGDPIGAVEFSFTDPGADTHELTCAWSDGVLLTLSGVTSPSVCPGRFGLEPGIYTVTVTITDDDGGAGSDVTGMIVVYDPSGGFVTGGGWFYSDPGNYAPDASLEGKATFGFVSKYKKGATVPTGNTEFQFKAGDLNFHSSSYDWLVVTGSDYAKFKGIGTINGAGEYKFMVWARDDDADTFRIKIWTEDGTAAGAVVYDNGSDQAIGRGNIVVHKK
jgi:hypothetical protein